MSLRPGRPCLRASLCAALLPLAAVAHAGNGVVEINAVRAAAGGVTPGDQPGLPVTLTIPGSYRLTGNLHTDDANKTVILVQSVDVSLDLNGFEISGPANCSGLPAQACSGVGNGIGIASSGFVQVAVRNGTVRGMGSSGLSLWEARVEGVRSIGNGGYGILVWFGLVRDCVVVSNRFAGAQVLHGNVARSQARANGMGGLVVGEADLGGVASASSSSGNGGAGLRGFRSVIVGNSSAQNVGAALDFDQRGGFVSNVLSGPVPVVTGSPVPMGRNVCNGVICP